MKNVSATNLITDPNELKQKIPELVRGMQDAQNLLFSSLSNLADSETIPKEQILGLYVDTWRLRAEYLEKLTRGTGGFVFVDEAKRARELEGMFRKSLEKLGSGSPEILK